ncbi:C40 family peptidase [Desulfosporosinus sp. PR]|uniref:C40 family peptidase n=1 Tax=Candidatus Desulfosporosinus nitrosoreducens TaxID=3401928 RepID=UPI0027F5F685|nr:C40 family peptidase [Desulfosporosinus sp. PR]MDQ7093940.1 C40 family peptidase [Desulfosporosinus sp. PR]
MPIPASSRMWLGSGVLAGLILASSLPAFAITPTVSSQSMSVASITVSTGPYVKTVRTQLQWKSSSLSSLEEIGSSEATASTNLVPASNNSTNTAAVPAKAQPAAQDTMNSPRPVQVAVSSSKQVSRSDSSLLIDHALSLQGVPYQFGGTSRSGFDCSGFTQYVYKASSKFLPRTAAEQFSVGSSVGRGQLQPGDLVFFSTYSQGASHVGIYIGGGRFVHASNTGVCITNLSDSYYSARYLGARRVN